MSVVELRAGSRTVNAHRESDGAIRIGDVRYVVEPIGDGLLSISDGATRWTVAVAGTGAERWVFVNGEVARIEIGTAGAPRRRSGSSAHELSSPMPATVVRIHVDAGATVAKGDLLLTLEAMKMELSIRAPRDGAIAAIHCKVGELVQPAVNLLDLA